MQKFEVKPLKLFGGYIYANHIMGSTNQAVAAIMQINPSNFVVLAL